MSVIAGPSSPKFLDLHFADSYQQPVRVFLQGKITVVKLKDHVMKKYNVDQKGISSDIKLVSFKSIKIESTDPMFSLKYSTDYIQKMLDDEETNLHEFIVTAKVSYMSLLCINKNIHTRLLLRRKEFKEVLGYGYTSFTYRCRETTVKVKLVIFSVVSRNGDGSINITVESKLPNDKGEPIISKFPFFSPLERRIYWTDRTDQENRTLWREIILLCD